MDTKLKVNETFLAPNLKLRPAQWADLNPVAQLILDVCTADGDPTFATTEAELNRFWHSPEIKLETDLWVVETKDGKIVGYQEFDNRYAHASLMGDGYVHPDYHGQGIGTTMLRALEARARAEIKLAEPDLRVFIRNGMPIGDTSARELHETEGYRPIRFSWRMEIKLAEAPRIPVWPSGIELRPFVLDEHNHAVFEAHEEAFSDHWGHTPGTFERWRYRLTNREDFDPSLWFIAWDGDEIAGYCLCRYRMGSGWVGTLGVRRLWRKRGLGEALLLHSFGEFYERGMKTIGLGVDAQNPTGATRLYKKAGMYVAAEYVIYEKELRPGREPAEQEQEREMKTDLQEELETHLSEGFTMRGARMEDIEPSLKMINAWSQSVIQEDEITDVNAIRTEWKSPGFDPARDIRLIFAPNGEMAGYIEVWTTGKPPVHPWIWGRVHPTYEGLGIGTWMLHWGEQRAVQALQNVPEGLRFAPRVGTFHQAEKPRKLFEDRGYRHIRSSYHMVIEMEGPVPEPVWPAGITVRTYNPETDAEAVYRADTESFRDHFGFVEEPFEEGFERFKHFQLEYEGFDPTLLFLAMAGEEVAGINICRPHSFAGDPDLGWVGTLAVRRPWRKRGIGLALLRHSFNEFYRRGKRKVGLGVDAENLTGALRLYENAGMHVHRAFDLYEKELRAGTEISVQSLQQ